MSKQHPEVGGDSLFCRFVHCAYSDTYDPFVTSWTVAHQAPVSMGFSRQEHCSGLPFPSPGDLPNPATEPVSLTSSALEARFFTAQPLRKPCL